MQPTNVKNFKGLQVETYPDGLTLLIMDSRTGSKNWRWFLNRESLDDFLDYSNKKVKPIQSSSDELDLGDEFNQLLELIGSNIPKYKPVAFDSMNTLSIGKDGQTPGFWLCEKGLEEESFFVIEDLDGLIHQLVALKESLELSNEQD